MSASRRPLSFREEAQARAARLQSLGTTMQEAQIQHPMMDDFRHESSEGRTPSTPSPLHPLQQSEWPSSSSSQQQQQPYSSTSPSLLSSASSLFHSSNTTTTTSTTPTTDVRQDWRRHGAGLSQLLEERRNSYASTTGCYVIRIVSTEPRVDLSGATYTAYILRISTPAASGSDYLVEHRYSDFGKLQHVLEQSHITVDAAFPSKHWAGRLGNWTPSLTWAPDQHDELIQYRKIQLDVWLVHVVHLYNQQQQQPQQHASSNTTLPPMVQTAIYDFLQPTQKPPCDQIHDWAMTTTSPNGNNKSNNSTTTLKSIWEHAKWNNPLSFTLGSSIRQAVTTLHYMCRGNNQQDHSFFGSNASTDHNYYSQQQQRWQESDASIPLDLLHAAKGLMFLTVFKAGLVVSGRLGTGLIIAKLEDDVGNPASMPLSPSTAASTPSSRWSAPCAIGTLGMGWGALAGGDVTHYLIVFTSRKAVRAMVGGSSVQFGAEVDVAVGPMGRGATSHVSASNHDWSLHPAYAYAHSQGFFAGMSLEGSVVAVRPEVNAKFYGQPIDALTILQRPGVNAAVPLYQTLEEALGLNIPSRGIRPSQIWSSPTTSSTTAPSSMSSSTAAVPQTPQQYQQQQQPPQHHYHPTGSIMSPPPVMTSPPHHMASPNNLGMSSMMSTPIHYNDNYSQRVTSNSHTI